jgi:hypothetical protein
LIHLDPLELWAFFDDFWFDVIRHKPGRAVTGQPSAPGIVWAQNDPFRGCRLFCIGGFKFNLVSIIDGFLFLHEATLARGGWTSAVHVNNFFTTRI